VLGFTPTLGQSRVVTVHIVNKTLLCQIIPHLLGHVFTSLVDIEKDDILELDQWNHLNVLDVERIMHQTWLDMIKFDKHGELKQN
jgi:hypothetical protein